MGLIVSNKKYEKVLKKIENLEKLKEELKSKNNNLSVKVYELERELKRLNKIIKNKEAIINSQNESMINAFGSIEELKCSNTYLEYKIDEKYKEVEELEEKIVNINKKHKDLEFKTLLSIKNRCKKARVKTKYKNKILDLAEKRLLELER